MEPKFQSSFIPKGPIAGVGTSGVTTVRKDKSLLSFISGTVFTISLCLALLVFGYKVFLGYRINKMGTELEAARAQLAPDTIREITRLNDRIISTNTLIGNHRAITPLLDFIEAATLKAVRFSEFSYEDTPKGINVRMQGQARGYSALALQADMFAKSPYFKDTVFSDLHLNDVGNVTFSMNTLIGKDLVSYKKEVERAGKPVVIPVTVAATSTATTTQSAVGCDYQCLITAAAQCKAASGTITYTNKPVVFPAGLIASGSTKYELKPSGTKCSIISTFVTLSFVAGPSASSEVKSQLKGINESVKETMGIATTCTATSKAVSSYLTDLKNGTPNEGDAEFSGGATSASSIKTSTGETLACTTPNPPSTFTPAQ